HLAGEHEVAVALAVDDAGGGQHPPDCLANAVGYLGGDDRMGARSQVEDCDGFFALRGMDTERNAGGKQRCDERLHTAPPKKRSLTSQEPPGLRETRQLVSGLRRAPPHLLFRNRTEA